MKVACPNCQKAIKVPDEWAGRTARCPHCKSPFVVPGQAAAKAPQATSRTAPAGPQQKTPPADPDSIDLQALAGMVPDDNPSDITPMDDVPPPGRKRSWFSPKPATQTKGGKVQVVKGPDGRTYRLCPHCGQQSRGDDLYMDAFCAHCGKTIPAATEAEEIDIPDGQSLMGGRGRDRKLTVGFYDGLVQAFGYPFGALESIAMGALVAIGVIVIPTALMMGLIYVMKQEPVSGDKFDVGNWPGLALFCVLMVQLIYCAGVGFYALIDSIRSTVSGAEKPPQLVWNLTTVMESLLSYIGFMIFYALLVMLGLWITGRWPDTPPRTLDDLSQLTQSKGMYAYLAILTFFMPMTIIGLATGTGLQGLNPFRIVRSIASTALHYGFLYCIVLIYAGLIGISVVTMIGYTGEAIVSVYRQGFNQGAGQMALGVVFWGLLLAGGFYGQYVLGRILGLFAREFQYKLAFTS